MNTSSTASVEHLAEQLEKDGEYLQTLLLKDTVDPKDYAYLITPFVLSSRHVCGLLAASSDYKRCFFVSRKTQKIMVQILKTYMQFSDERLFNIKDIFDLAAESKGYTQAEDNQIVQRLLQHPVDIQVKELPQRLINQLQIAQKTHSAVVGQMNNQGAIYVLRGKADTAVGCFLKAVELRLAFVNSNMHVFQIAILCMNLAFCKKTTTAATGNEIVTQASQLLNKAILLLEQLEKHSNDSSDTGMDLTESAGEFLCLVEMLYKKNDRDVKGQEISQNNRLIYLLSIAYNYYSEILKELNKQKEGEFCKKQSELLFSQFLKKQNNNRNIPNQTPNLNTTSLSMRSSNNEANNSATTPTLTSKNINRFFSNNGTKQNNQQKPFMQQNQQQQEMDDNFSHASFQSVNTTTQSLGAFGGQPISKEDIIFQKYIKVSEIRYKLVILQIKEYTCVQIILYSKPNSFLQKLIVGFPALIEYSHTLMMPAAFTNQDGLNAFFIEVARRLSIEKGMLKIKDLESYQSIEDLVKFSKVLPPNIHSQR